VTTSPFDILARYWQVKDAHPAPSAKPRRYVRGNFGSPDGTIEGLAPKGWNGPKFSAKHGGAYSKASQSLMPITGHVYQGGRVMEPTTSRVPKRKKASA
jgi:hypothetical protein